MFIDFLTLLLLNMAAGLAVLGVFFLRGMDGPNHKWASAFAIVGLVAFAGGLYITLTWPFPKLQSANLQWANTAFGETSVLLGVLFLGAALSVAKGWDLAPLGIYAFFAGAAAILIGVAMWSMWLTAKPPITATGFIVTGLAGVLTGPMLGCCHKRWLRVIVAVLLFASSAIWTAVWAPAYWLHLQSYSQLAH